MRQIIPKWARNEFISVSWRIKRLIFFNFFVWGYNMRKPWKFLNNCFYREHFSGRNCISQSWVEIMFINITPSIKKIVEQNVLESIVLQSIPCFKVIRMFNSWFSEKHRGSNVMFYFLSMLYSLTHFLFSKMIMLFTNDTRASIVA